MTRQKMQVGKRQSNDFISPREQLARRRAVVWRDIKRKMIANGEIENKVPAIWEWGFEEESGSVTAHTRSDAKAQIKQQLGIPKKKKLPREVVIQKVEFNERPT